MLFVFQKAAASPTILLMQIIRPSYSLVYMHDLAKCDQEAWDVTRMLCVLIIPFHNIIIYESYYSNYN